MTCASLRDAASELALDMLSGEERAAALAHLETCTSCRRDVTALTDAVEQVLMLAPVAVPSVGFEQRVLTRLEALAAADAATRTPNRTRGRRSATVRRVLAIAAILVAIVAAGVVVNGRSDDHHVIARTAEMRSGSGQVVGDVSVATAPNSIVVAIPDWVGLVQSYGATVDAPYWLAVQTTDGSRDLYRLPPADEHPWMIDIDVDPTTVATVSVVDNHGAVWCTAQFR